MELREIKGLGPKSIEALSKLNIYTYNDLIRYYPFRYKIYNPINIQDAGEETVVLPGTVQTNPKTAYIKSRFTKTSFQFLTNNILCNVVIFNRSYIGRMIHAGSRITVIGKYDKLKNIVTANELKYYEITKTEVEPVYHMVSDLKKGTLTKAINNALNEKKEIYEIVPAYLQEKYHFFSDYDAICEIHHPTSINSLKQAKLKLKYEELFEFMFKINLMKIKNQIMGEFVTKNVNENDLNEILAKLPYTLTDDQLNTIRDCMNDFTDDKRMNRLVIGDVGSGKTIIAFIMMILNTKAGYQSAMIAPTEVLATQHYENLLKLVDTSKIKVGLLVGSQKSSEKNQIIEKLKNNEIDILIGTHAMLEEKVVFNNIGLVITDEQHRFGVNQRKELQNKGRIVDVLYMSATPIPRTYALAIYGDMDISMIKQKPSGRKEIITKINKFNELDQVCKELKEELDSNHQAYIISPLIEDDNEEEDNYLSDIETIRNYIVKYIGTDYTIGILHGKMKQSEKDYIMEQYKENKINILISTTVIEVGVDVKNSTMIIIFNAERFGLSTLHQLRGRVGRNDLQSKCILVSDYDIERLKVLTESNDGFFIAEKDFELRGSGDLFGIKQSGDMSFKIANIQTDMKILLQCKQDTDEFIRQEIENGFLNYPYYKYIEKVLINNS